jgi:hypothetical protein
MIPGVFAGQMRPAAGVKIYLDDLSPVPRVAYSLKKVIRTAVKAIRVRRSSDNAEQDIGFVGDALDVAALTLFRQRHRLSHASSTLANTTALPPSTV